MGWHTGAAVPPIQKKKKKKEKFPLFQFSCFFSLNLTINLLVFQILHSIFKYSLNGWRCKLKLCALHFKHIQISYTKSCWKAYFLSCIQCSAVWIKLNIKNIVNMNILLISFWTLYIEKTTKCKQLEYNTVKVKFSFWGESCKIKTQWSTHIQKYYISQKF